MADIYPNTVYKIANERYFGNRLPKLRVWWKSEEELTNRLGRYCTAADDPTHHWIELNSKYKKESRIWVLTLLHEMAHVEQFMTHPNSADHGRIWKQIMLRLAKEGAFDDVW